MTARRAPTRRPARRKAPTPPPPRGSTLGRALSVALLGVVLMVGGGVGMYLLRPRAGRGRAVRVHVAPGDRAADITRALWQAEVIDAPWLFHALVAATGADRSAHRGAIALRDDLRPWVVLRTLLRGGSGVVRVTIPEGYTRFDVARRLAASEVCDEAAFVARTTAPEVLARHGLAPGGSVEGRLFPETYDLSPDTPPDAVIDRMVGEFSARFAALKREHPAVIARAAQVAGSPDGVDEVIVSLASLVERETGAPEDRAHVASVFWNRLLLPEFTPRLLQSDPTVTYGCLAHAAAGEPLTSCAGVEPGARRPITQAMLSDGANRYNTYRHEGLPPTPIANPGEAALRAALAPTDDRDLYFVARGEGRSVFAPTLELHRRNVQQYLRRAP